MIEQLLNDLNSTYLNYHNNPYDYIAYKRYNQSRKDFDKYIKIENIYEKYINKLLEVLK